MKFQLLSLILLLTSFTTAFTIPSHDLQHDVVLAPRAITPGTNTTIPDRKGGGGGHGGGGGESSGGGDSSSGGDDSSSSSGSTSSGAHTGSGTSAGNALGVEKVYILMVAGLVGIGVEVLGGA
jgi:hypothetical protein